MKSSRRQFLARSSVLPFLGLLPPGYRSPEDFYETMEATKGFLNATQNYPLLQGSQSNLFKCFLPQSWLFGNRNGVQGFLHPEGVYDDPNGQVFRKEIYQRLVFHFQFRNQLKLFAEIGDRVYYGIHIYTGLKPSISFNSINNLFQRERRSAKTPIHRTSNISALFRTRSACSWKLRLSCRHQPARFV